MKISHFPKKLANFLGYRILQIGHKLPPLNGQEAFFKKQYERNLEKIFNPSTNTRGFRAYREYRYDIGDPPFNQKYAECEFFAYHLAQAKPTKILDIGSYRDFLLGLLSHYDVTTVDVRNRTTRLKNEHCLTMDAKALDLTSDSFDAVLSMEVLSHIGLGRFGDTLDLEADVKAFQEMRRVLKPGGLILFTTAITGGPPSLAFNARRNYSFGMIREFCEGLELLEEKFFDRQHQRYCKQEELTTDSKFFDYYFGAFKKP